LKDSILSRRNRKKLLGEEINVRGRNQRKGKVDYTSDFKVHGKVINIRVLFKLRHTGRKRYTF